MELNNFGRKVPKVGCSRDFPPGFAISNSCIKGSFHHYIRDYPPGCGPNAPKTTQVGAQKCLEGVKGSGSVTVGEPSHWRRSVGAAKSKSQMMPIVDKLAVKKPLVEPIGFGSGQREKVLGILSLFRERCAEISKNDKEIKRVDIKANAELKNEGKLIKQAASLIGPVPGVEVGDKFHYRIELVIVGLHRLFQGGIDCMEYGGSKLATCIVANEGHLDKMNDPNVLTYIGEGGVLQRHEVGLPPDQQLKGGNLALSNSMKGKKPVRVVRGLKFDACRSQKIVYVYDGLYEVKSCEKKKGPQGNMIFEFQLIRCPGQPAVPWKEYRQTRF